MDHYVMTGATLEATWCPWCSRHAVAADGYCGACGSSTHTDED